LAGFFTVGLETRWQQFEQFLKVGLGEGMDAEENRKKNKNYSCTQPKARAGWPKRLRLVQATP